jgi:hypothetical protein
MIQGQNMLRGRHAIIIIRGAATRAADGGERASSAPPPLTIATFRSKKSTPALALLRGFLWSLLSPLDLTWYCETCCREAISKTWS